MRYHHFEDEEMADGARLTGLLRLREGRRYGCGRIIAQRRWSGSMLARTSVRDAMRPHGSLIVGSTEAIAGPEQHACLRRGDMLTWVR